MNITNCILFILPNTFYLQTFIDKLYIFEFYLGLVNITTNPTIVGCCLLKANYIVSFSTQDFIYFK